MSLVLISLLTVQLDTVQLDTVQLDTVQLGPGELVERVLTSAPGVEAASRFADAAEARARQARAWGNPTISVQFDNYGAEEEVTNIAGWRGLEGQAVVALPLPIGGDRGARIRRGEAEARVAEASFGMAQADAVLRLVAAYGAARRDTELLRQTRSEVETLEQLAEALGLQAELGRSSQGEAARARLALSVAREQLAMVAAQQRASAEELALVSGFEAGSVIDVVAPQCQLDERLAGAMVGSMEGMADGPAAGLADGSADDPRVGSVPEVRLAEARVASARADLDLARAGRIPDLTPEVGLRRTMGVEALYAGLSFDLPLFDRQSRSVDAARADALGAEAAGDDLQRALDAQRAVARGALEALTEAGRHFTSPDWGADLEASVRAVEARWELGEGTLLELLDGRRARIDAISARGRWGAQWLTARARVARLNGAPLGADLICDPIARETP
jgi:cobalt-zinc-cadmium efflux system outer membrane protein